MKRAIPLILSFLTISCSSNMNHIKIENEAASEAFFSLQNDFHLHLIDHKLIRSPKLKKITVDFYHFGAIDIREARLMIHKCANHLLDSFNGVYRDQGKYHHFPLTQNDLEISISFVDPMTHKMHSEGPISHASLIGGRIHYSKYVESEERHETVLQESFISYQTD